MIEQLTYVGPDKLQWREAPAPRLTSDRAALVRPLAVATCDLDGLIIAGACPFEGPFPLGHESVAEVIDVGGYRPGSIGLYAAAVATAVGAQRVWWGSRMSSCGGWYAPTGRPS